MNDEDRIFSVVRASLHEARKFAKTAASSFSRSLKSDASIRLCHLNGFSRVARKSRHQEVVGGGSNAVEIGPE